MRKRWILGVSVILWVVILEYSALAHANLARSEPPPNAILEQAPAEIRLWFTEPLEPEFSRIVLRTIDGSLIETESSQVDAADPLQMALSLGELPDGVYTVSWRALSSADGHQTQGSFPLTIGPASLNSAITAQNTLAETVPLVAAGIRWLNLSSLALLIGGMGFWVFVWQPTAPSMQPEIENRMLRLIWLGWWLTGLSGILVLLLQVSVVTEIPLLQTLSSPELSHLINGTRFGQLWQGRTALWILVGVALYGWQRLLALVLGLVLLLTVSLFSHAASARDASLAIAADWLHLVAMALWIGGLVQFVNVIGPLRRHYQGESPVLLGRMVGYFSTFARIAVLILFITGFYASWLQVAEVQGLLETLYGQLLIIKLLLFVPLLLIAAVNLLFTQRALNAGKIIWTRWLRALVGAEITLTVAILLAVGMMTSIAPARSVLAVRAAAPPEVEPYYDSFSVNDEFHVDLQIEPGFVGENTFSVYLYTHDGVPIDDASLIRLRFDHQTQDLGTSELRPQPVGGGFYVIGGANLSTIGEWRIRATIQRPGQFDTVIDFLPEIGLPPVRPPLAVETWPNRVPVLLLVGTASIAAGGFFIGLWGLQSRRQSHAPVYPQILSLALIILGLGFLVNGVQSLQMANMQAPRLPDDAPIRLAVSRTSDFPYLITADGSLLRPVNDGQWRRIALDTTVKDVYADTFGRLWLATSSGLQAYKDGLLSPVDPLPVNTLEESHGYVFALGEAGMARITYGPLLDLSHLREITLPLQEQPGAEFIMLGNHSHILQNGTQVFQSPDLGLTWVALNAPGTVDAIWTDIDGNLVAATPEGVFSWTEFDRTWRARLPLPDNLRISSLHEFKGKLFSLAGGRFYRQSGGDWQQIDLPESAGAYLVAAHFKYPDTFWVLDATGMRLWSTTDGEAWALTPIIIQ